MVLLFGRADLNVWDHVDTRAEEDFRVFVDAADGGHVLAVFHGELFEETGQWLEAVLDIVLVGIAAHEEKNADQVRQ